MVMLVDYNSSESDQEMDKDTGPQPNEKGKKKKVIVIKKPSENSPETSDNDFDKDVRAIRKNASIQKTLDFTVDTHKPKNSLLGRLPQAKDSIKKNSHVFSNVSKLVPHTDSKSEASESFMKKLEYPESKDFNFQKSVSFFSLESDDGVGTSSSFGLQINELENNGLQNACCFDADEHTILNNTVTGDLNDFMIPNREFHFDSLCESTDSICTPDHQFFEFQPICAEESRKTFEEQQFDGPNEQTGNIKRKKVGSDSIPDTFVEISQEEILSYGREYLKNISKPVDVISIPKSELPDATSRKRHQITFLAFKAKEQEASLKNAWAQSKSNRVQSKKRYGFA